MSTEKAAAKTAKKAGQAATPESDKVRCRVKAQFEMGDATISKNHKEPIFLPEAKAKQLESMGKVDIVGI